VTQTSAWATRSDRPEKAEDLMTGCMRRPPRAQRLLTDSQAALTPTAPPQRVDTSRASDPATADATRWWRRPRDARLWTDLDDMKRTGGVRRGHGATDADTGPAPTPAPPTYEMTAPVTRSRRKITGSTMLS